MKARVHYVSPKGSAELVAEAIARELLLVKEALPPAYMPEGVKLMFLGCEGKKVDKVTAAFIQTMDPKRVENVALFCCNPQKDGSVLDSIASELSSHGVNVLPERLITTGKGGFLGGGSHPGDQDIQAAHAFAASCVKEVFGSEK